jgi:hypothetical protein
MLEVVAAEDPAIQDDQVASLFRRRRGSGLSGRRWKSKQRNDTHEI